MSSFQDGMIPVLRFMMWSSAESRGRIPWQLSSRRDCIEDGLGSMVDVRGSTQVRESACISSDQEETN